MTTPSGTTTEGGTVFLTVELGPPWPAAFEVLNLLRINLLDGVFTLAVNSLGQLCAEITKTGLGIVFGVVGCPLLTDKRQLTVISVTWQMGTLRINANGHLVGSSDPSDITYRSLRLLPPDRSGITTRDYTKKNERCISNRSGRLRGLVLKSGPKLESPEQMFEALHDQILVLKDLRQHLLEGKHHHIRSVAGALRNLVADNKTMPLLQRCAALIEAPLILYTVADPAAPFPVKPHDHIALTTDIEPTDGLRNPIDLDLWLELNAGHPEGQPYTNLTLLLAIAHSVGSHADPTIHPAVERLKAYFQRLPDSDSAAGASMLVSVLSNIALMIIVLAERVMSSSHSVI